MNSLKEGCINNSRTEILVDVGGKQTPVPVISHMSSIVDASDEELESVPGDFLILIQIKTQKILTHLKDKERGVITVNTTVRLSELQMRSVEMSMNESYLWYFFKTCFVLFFNKNFIATGNTY